MKKVLITEKIHPDAEALLRRHFEVVQGSGTANVAAELAGCEGVLVRSAHVTAEDMAKNPQLKVIAKHGMGLDAIDMEAAEQRGIAVVNAPYSNLNAVGGAHHHADPCPEQADGCVGQADPPAAFPTATSTRPGS